MVKRVGVFGGSFDPPHIGHFALVALAKERLALDEVWVVPVGKAVHRALTTHVSAMQRLQWVKELFLPLSYVQVLDWEVQASHPVPTIETMRRVAEVLSLPPYWLMGMDAWKNIPSWVGYPEHCSLCNVAVLERHGEVRWHDERWKETSHYADDLPAGHVCYINGALPAVSATEIRQAILMKEDVSAVLDATIKSDIQAAYTNQGSYEVDE